MVTEKGKVIRTEGVKLSGDRKAIYKTAIRSHVSHREWEPQ